MSALSAVPDEASGGLLLRPDVEPRDVPIPGRSPRQCLGGT